MIKKHIQIKAQRRALVAGWFSFSHHGHATAGDLLAAELTCDWLQELGYTFDIALDPPFQGGVDWRQVDSENYTHVIFVCGPFGKSRVTEEFMNHFKDCKMVGLNLTMNQPLAKWNPFDSLFERNNSLAEVEDVTWPDITFLSPRPLVPVVGVCLVEAYGAPFEKEVYAAIKDLMLSREIAVVNIDTRLDENRTSLCSPTEVESLLARMDAVVTTRLHGTVLSLKNGVPVVAIDPGGDSLKIKRLAKKIGWPFAFKANQLSNAALQGALNFCLSPEGRRKAEECTQRAKKLVEEIHLSFKQALEYRSEAEQLSAMVRERSSGKSRILVQLDRHPPW